MLSRWPGPSYASAAATGAYSHLPPWRKSAAIMRTRSAVPGRLLMHARWGLHRGKTFLPLSGVAGIPVALLTCCECHVLSYVSHVKEEVTWAHMQVCITHIATSASMHLGPPHGFRLSHLGLRGKLPPRETAGQISGLPYASLHLAFSHVPHAWACSTLLRGGRHHVL